MLASPTVRLAPGSTFHGRRALTPTDILWAVAIIALLIAVLLPSLGRARQLAKQAVCRSNLRGIGMGMHIYANDYAGVGPRHYFEAKAEDTGTIRDAGVSWVGAMGSNADLKISEATSPTKSPTRSHPSRSSFLLVIIGNITVTQMVCPSSGDQQDDLRNVGADGNVAPDQMIAAQPGMNRFDFRGYDRLSYGIALPFSQPLNLHAAEESIAIAADKGPYYRSGGPGLPGTGTTIDARSALNPPADWSSRSAENLTAANQDWRPYNSRNHGGEGQTIAFADGHAEFAYTPLAGVNQDHIYTIADGLTPQQRMIGIVPDASQTFGPALDTDSFIVP